MTGKTDQVKQVIKEILAGNVEQLTEITGNKVIIEVIVELDQKMVYLVLSVKKVLFTETTLGSQNPID